MGTAPATSSVTETQRRKISRRRANRSAVGIESAAPDSRRTSKDRMSAAATHAAPAAVASASAGRAGRARAAAKVRLATRVSPRTPLFFAASLDRRFLISGARSGGARRARPGAGARGARRPRRAPTAISRKRGRSRPRVTRRRDEGRADAPRPSAVAPERRAGPSPSLQDPANEHGLSPRPLPAPLSGDARASRRRRPRGAERTVPSHGAPRAIHPKTASGTPPPRPPRGLPPPHFLLLSPSGDATRTDRRVADGIVARKNRKRFSKVSPQTSDHPADLPPPLLAPRPIPLPR